MTLSLGFAVISIMVFIGSAVLYLPAGYSPQPAKNMLLRLVDFINGLAFEFLAVSLCLHDPANSILIAAAAVAALFGYMKMRACISPGS